MAKWILMNGIQNFIKSTRVTTTIHSTPNMTDAAHIEYDMAKESETQVKQNKGVSREMDLMEPRISSNRLVFFCMVRVPTTIHSTPDMTDDAHIE